MRTANKLRSAGLAIILSWGWKRATIALAAGATLSPQAPLVITFPSQIAFDGLGIPYTDQPATIKLAAMATISLASGGSTLTVRIYPGTGMVRVP